MGAYYDRRGKSTVESELDGTQVHYSEDSICDGMRSIILRYCLFLEQLLLLDFFREQNVAPLRSTHDFALSTSNRSRG